MMEASLSPIPFLPFPVVSPSFIATIVCVPTTTVSLSLTICFKLSIVSLFSAVSSALASLTTVYSVPLIVTFSFSFALPIMVCTSLMVVPIVYPLEPIVIVSPYFSAVMVKVAVPVPTPTRLPGIPASFALTVLSEVLPFPFNR